MKKNTFKNYDVKEDGTRTFKKQPFWMHSIDKPVAKNEKHEIIYSFLFVIAFGILISFIYIIIGGE